MLLFDYRSKIIYNESSQNNKLIAEINPFRYRGYYYDVETGLYYLNSRYYDPSTGRFINADGLNFLEQDKINGLNLYAYCGNNPVMNIDPNGNFFLSFLIAGILFGAISGAVVGGIKASKNGTSILGGILGGAVMGGAMGAVMVIGGAAGLTTAGFTITGFGLSAISSLFLSATIGFTSGWISYTIESGLNNNWNLFDSIKYGISGVAQAIVSFGIGFLGGRYTGAFDKLILSPFISQIPQIGKQFAYSLGKIAIGRTFVSPIAEFILKTFFFSGSAAILRLSIKKYFK